MTPPRNGEERLSPRQTHGTKALKRAVKTLGSRVVDRRTAVGKALVAWRSDLLADLGGREAVSTQELALIEEAVKTKLILDSVNAWLLSRPTLVNKRTHSVLPAVRDRSALVNTLRGLLSDLGLKRRARELPSLALYVETARKSGQPEDATHENAGESTNATSEDLPYPREQKGFSAVKGTDRTDRIGADTDKAR